MNKFRKARIKKSIKYPIFSDKRSVSAFNIGISNYEYSKIEKDDAYIAHPIIYLKLLELFQDIELAKSLCDKCIINSIDTEKFEQKFIKKNKQVELRLEQDYYLGNEHTYFYLERLNAARYDYHYLNRDYVCNKTGLGRKKMKLLETDNNYISRFEEQRVLIEEYQSHDLLKKVCSKCLIKDYTKKLEGKENN